MEKYLKNLITITHNGEQFQWNISFFDFYAHPQLQGNYIMTLIEDKRGRLISMVILNLEMLTDGICVVCQSMDKLNVKMVCGKCIDKIGPVTKTDWGYESREFVMIDNSFQRAFHKVICDVRTLWWPLLVGGGHVRKCLVCTRDVYGDVDIDCDRLLSKAFFRDYTYIFWLMTHINVIADNGNSVMADIVSQIIRAFINPYTKTNYIPTIPNGKYPLTQKMGPWL
jgi:hypothetical protein